MLDLALKFLYNSPYASIANRFCVTTLTDHCVGPADPTKKPKQLVIFLHGHGSSGQLMADYMGPILSPMLPEAKLVFLSGPEMDSSGTLHSWIEIMPESEVDKTVIGARMHAATASVNNAIDSIIQREEMKNRQVVVAGFSLGATMAFFAGLMRKKPVAGIYAMSAGALDQVTDPQSKSPVCLVIGEKEQLDYNGVEQNKAALKQLKAMGVMSVCEVIPDHGHEISKRVMELLSLMVNNVTSRKFKLKYHFEKLHKKHKAHKKPHQSRRQNHGK